MADNKTQSKRDERFRKLYNADMTSDSQSTSDQLVTVIDDMILEKYTPQAAAQRTASLVMRETEPETPFGEILAVCQHAAMALENENDMKKVVDFLIALASLPDAINDASEPKKASTYNPEVKSGILTFRPGEAIVFETGVLWRDLPGWQMMITEEHQGQ
jgi:hypothetical protein